MNNDTKEINEEKIIRLKKLSQNLDESITIPGTQRKIGFDAIIGIIPGAGDAMGGGLSLYIMYSGIKMGVPRATVYRMATNILLEATIGLIPIIGDLFDAFWKSNKKNVKLIENAVHEDIKDKNINYFIMFSLAIVLIIIIVLIANILQNSIN